MSRLLKVGERVLLLDAKRRRYLVTLAEGGEFHSHAGVLPHDELIGQAEGITVKSTMGGRYTAVRPTLSEYVLEMPRGAQVIYPKDLGPILLLADVYPGARVLESGVGSGACSAALLRAGAELIGYEMREDFANRARKNVEGFLGAEVAAGWDVQVRDIYEGIEAKDLDRVVLDLPEPWRVVPHLQGHLNPGGIVVAYTPQITQAAELRHTLAEGPFGFAETIEVLHRGWYIEGQAVRPDHRMVAHTAFLTVARWLG